MAVRENLFKLMMRADTAVAAEKTKKQKVEALKRFDTLEVKILLALTFNPGVVWKLPEGTPPFKTEANGIDSEPILMQVLRHDKLKFYIKGTGYDNLRSVKLEQMFVNILGEMHPEDAAMICAIKDKKPPFKNINLVLVKEAFPDIAKDW